MEEGNGNDAANGNETLGISANRTLEEVTVRAHDRVNQIVDAARPAVDRMASNAHSAIETVAGAAATAVDTLGAKGEQLTNAPSKLMEAERAYTRQQPMAALGVAVVAGSNVGRLTR